MLLRHVLGRNVHDTDQKSTVVAVEAHTSEQALRYVLDVTAVEHRATLLPNCHRQWKKDQADAIAAIEAFACSKKSGLHV